MKFDEVSLKRQGISHDAHLTVQQLDQEVHLKLYYGLTMIGLVDKVFSGYHPNSFHGTSPRHRSEDIQPAF